MENRIKDSKLSGECDYAGFVEISLYFSIQLDSPAQEVTSLSLSLSPVLLFSVQELCSASLMEEFVDPEAFTLALSAHTHILR